MWRRVPVKLYKPIESKTYPGSYHVYGHSNYRIYRDGSLFNYKTGYIRKPSENEDGYITYGSLIGDDGYYHSASMHRLLGLTFKHPGPDYNKLEINHDDGDKQNNDLDNFTWMNRLRNLEHAGAMGLTDKCCPISIRNINTGKIHKFPSIIKCARFLGISKDRARLRFNLGERRIWPCGYQFRKSWSDEPWYVHNDVDKALFEAMYPKAIMIKHVLTGEIREFLKPIDLARYLNVSPSVITVMTKKKGQPVLHGFIQVKWKSDQAPWRPIIDPYMELMKGTKAKVVKVVKDSTKEIFIYYSPIKCARAMGISPTLTDYRLKSQGKIVFSDGCRYGYYPY